MRVRSLYLWIFAFLLVAFAAVYQRMTGPSYPVRGTVKIGGSEIRFRLPRTFGGEGNAEVRLPVSDRKVSGIIDLRRFRSSDRWQQQDLVREGDDLTGVIPHQPPAGKVMYRISLSDGATQVLLTEEPVIIRFKGDVPGFVMVPHIFLMFLAMLFSTRAGMEALAKQPHSLRLALWTIVTVGIGGLLLGPIIQKYAFGAYWTGWPLGKDLTDNKTVVAFAGWMLAFWRIRKRPDETGWVIAASAVLFLVYMIPHSLLGSELDYTAPGGM